VPDLNHSARSLERSTYTPISLPNRRPVSDYGRAIEKLGYFNALGSSEEEFGLALEKLRGDARFTPEEVLAFSDLKPDLVPPRSQGSMSVRAHHPGRVRTCSAGAAQATTQLDVALHPAGGGGYPL
jgi:hypothetical protein